MSRKLKCMPPLEGDIYEGRYEGLQVLVEQWKAQSVMYGWNGVLEHRTITPANSSGHPTKRNFSVMYGSISMDECFAHAIA
jgi:hypothetical protein